MGNAAPDIVLPQQAPPLAIGNDPSWVRVAVIDGKWGGHRVCSRIQIYNVILSAFPDLCYLTLSQPS